MSDILSINIDELLNCGGVESARIEFKASWDEKTTAYQVLKTICAFANDVQNLNGGYIVIGVEEDRGVAILPPKGIDEHDAEMIQKWIRGNCNRIDPIYQPIFSPELVDGKHIMVIWVPGSDARPHKAPDGEKGSQKYWVRIGPETVDAEKNGVLHQLLQMTAKIPFDDRRSLNAVIEDMREAKAREFLRDISSGLLAEENTKQLYRKMRIAVPVNGHDVPKNIGLLMFAEEAGAWFAGSRIEIVQFAAGAAGNILEEKYFKGGIHEQLRDALSYLEHILSSHITKSDTSFHVKGWVSYPIPALREALVNAVYHRSYEADMAEPVKMYLYPDRMEITSYPGPVPGIRLEHLQQKENMPMAAARNRRIGEFLKELKLAEGRGTGLPKLYKAMRENGSKDPQFDFDEARSYFRVTLSAHPEYIAISALRDAAHLRTVGNDSDADKRIEESWQRLQNSPSLTAEMIHILGKKGNPDKAEEIFSVFKSKTSENFMPFVTNVLIEALLNSHCYDKAKKHLKQIPQIVSSSDALESAILARRLGNQQDAHRYFERAGDALLQDVRGIHEFARTKIKLAGICHRQGNDTSNKRYLHEAQELLERVIQMEADDTRHAWAWRDLAKVKRWLKAPLREIQNAFQQAISLLPNEPVFQNEFPQFENDAKRRR